MNLLAEMSLTLSSDIVLACLTGAGAQFAIVVKMLLSLGHRLTTIETRLGIVEAVKARADAPCPVPIKHVTRA